MIGFYDYTVIATYVSLGSSVAGILLAAVGKPFWAILALMLSGLLDTFDGKIARTKKDRTVREERFGVQIDSLCDLVCFGVLPVVIGYFAAPNPLTSPFFYIYAVAGIIYILGGVIRLSFFNIGEEEQRESTVKVERKTYTGLPITTASLVFPIVYIFRHFFLEKAWIFSMIWAAFLLLVAFCFVGKFHVRKPTNRQLILLIVFGVVIAVAVWVIYGLLT